MTHELSGFVKAVKDGVVTVHTRIGDFRAPVSAFDAAGSICPIRAKEMVKCTIDDASLMVAFRRFTGAEYQAMWMRAIAVIADPLWMETE